MSAAGTGLRLTGIYLYPLKSAAALSVPEVAVDRIGLAGDRRWMLIGAGGRAVTQRESPRLARVRAVPGAEGALEVEARGMPPIRVPVPPATGEVLGARIHRRAGFGRAAGREAAAWFSEFLGTPCRLLFLPPELAIPVAPPWAAGDDRTGFSDGFPILLIGEASLAELNERLERPVPMNRFRPSLVVAGTRPFEEDGWDEIRIGRLRLRAAKPCPRCVVTTVDQVTGIPDPSGEPLVTLAGFRKRDGKVWFGMNLLLEGTGSVRVGDAVTVK